MVRTMLISSLVAAGLWHLAGCCCASGDETCTASIRYKGKTYQAKSDASNAKPEATRLACRSYCKTDDPEVETAWRTWKASPEGVKSTRDRDLEMDIRTSLSDAVNRCQGTCLAEMVMTPALASVSCTK